MTQASAPPQEDGLRLPLDLRLFWPAMVAWAVTAVALPWRGWTLVALAAGVVTAAALVLARASSRPDLRAPVALSAVVCLAVLVAVGMHGGAREAGPVARLAEERAQVSLTGSLRGDPRALRSTGASGTPTVLMTLEVTEVRAAGTSTAVATPVLVLTSPDDLDLRWGDRVRVRGALSPAEPGDDVVAVLRAGGGATPLASGGAALALADHVRASLRAAVGGVPDDARGLVPAMVVGDRSQQDASLVAAMRDTGLTHLSAVSGTNVTYVLLAAMGLARLVALPRRLRPLLGLLALAFFVLLARPDPSVIRAAAMGSVGLLGLLRHRRGAGPPALAAAVLALLLWDPWLARDVGFALSVLASTGLLLFARPWGEAIADLMPPWARPLGFALAIPAAAQVMCGPVLVLLQPSLPLWSIPANLVVAPLVAPVTLAGLATAVVGSVQGQLGALLAWTAAVPAQCIAWVARAMASLPGGQVPWVAGPVGAVLLALVTVAILTGGPLLQPLTSRMTGTVLAWGAALALVLWVATIVPLPPRVTNAGEWVFAACDVGQGDALVLSTGTPGHAVLVDAGREPALVRTCLERLGIVHLDAVVLTHYDGDHVDGLPGAVTGREVGAVITTRAAETAGRPAVVREAVESSGARVSTVRAGDRLTWGQVVATVVQPASSTPSSSVNASSLVLDVRSAGVRLLLLADVDEDASAAALRRIRSQPGQPPVDIVKVSHHGSAAVAPHLYRDLGARLAVISVGKDNTYGHPAPRVLEDLRAAGSVVWRTDQQGGVVVHVDPAAPGTGAGPEIAVAPVP